MYLLQDNDMKKARHLLDIFDGETLGDGDVNAGVNTLVAMASAIANVHPPGSCFVSGRGEKIAVGTSFMVSGELSQSLIREKVIAPVTDRQTNLLGHLSDWQLSADIENSKSKQVREFDPEVLLAADLGSVILNHHQEDEQFPGTELRAAALLVQPAPERGKLEIHRHPQVFITAACDVGLEKQLPKSHMGRAFALVTAADANRCAHFEKICSAILDGCSSSSGPVPEYVRGNVFGMVAFDALESVVGGNGVTWLNRMPWLTDGSVGPEIPTSLVGTPSVVLTGVLDRYNAALDEAFACRLEYRVADSSQLRCDFEPAQRRWVAFLKEHEARFPGITGAARSLVVTLAFGLVKLASARGAKGIGWVLEDVEALARILILRMINARTAILRDDGQTRMESLAIAIAMKLGDGPLTVRELIRKSHRLLTADCVMALEFLRSSNCVVREGESWILARSPAEVVSKFQPLTLDV
jgi:hypothetical protein